MSQVIGAPASMVIDGMAEWQNRPLGIVYPAIFLDALHVKISALAHSS
ncbi:transposase [Nocardia sp. NPDC004168]